MESFTKIVNDFQPFTIAAKLFILDACEGPVYIFDGPQEIN